MVCGRKLSSMPSSSSCCLKSWMSSSKSIFLSCSCNGSSVFQFLKDVLADYGSRATDWDSCFCSILNSWGIARSIPFKYLLGLIEACEGRLLTKLEVVCCSGESLDSSTSEFECECVSDYSMLSSYCWRSCICLSTWLNLWPNMNRISLPCMSVLLTSCVLSRSPMPNMFLFDLFELLELLRLLWLSETCACICFFIFLDSKQYVILKIAENVWFEKDETNHHFYSIMYRFDRSTCPQEIHESLWTINRQHTNIVATRTTHQSRIELPPKLLTNQA